MKKLINNPIGMTLIELMVAMAIFALVIGSIYAAFQSQLTAHLTQQNVADLQQNARGALSLLKRDIRMAGWPLRDTSNPATSPGIQILPNGNIELRMDIHDGVDNDGDTIIDEEDEKWNPDGSTDDTDELVLYSISGGTLFRNNESLGVNVDALDMVFLDGGGTIQITMVARTTPQAGILSYKYLDGKSYRNPQGAEILPPQNDFARRWQLMTKVRCRNVAYQN